MNTERNVDHPKSEKAQSEAVSRRRAIARFAGYTAPIMLAALASEKAMANISYQ